MTVSALKEFIVSWKRKKRRTKNLCETHYCRGMRQEAINCSGLSEKVSEKEGQLRLILRDEQEPARKGGETLQSEETARRIFRGLKESEKRAGNKRLGFVENIGYIEKVHQGDEEKNRNLGTWKYSNQILLVIYKIRKLLMLQLL